MAGSFDHYVLLYVDGPPADPIRIGQMIVDLTEPDPLDMLQVCTSLSPLTYEPIHGGGGGSVTWQDEGTPVVTSATANFVGAGVTVTDVAGVATITISSTGSQAGIQWKDEGSNLGTSGTVTSVDFVGAGVTATRSVDAVTVTIPDWQAKLQYQDEGSNLGTSGTVTTVNFTGAGVTASRASNTVTVDIPAPGGGIPTNTQTGNYTLVLGDAGYCIYRDGSNSACTWTIPANASVAFPAGASGGTVVMFDNRDSSTNVTIAITSDTLVYTPGGATGSRTLLPGGRAFAHKVTSTLWHISGTGVY